jgi:dUTPase
MNVIGQGISKLVKTNNLSETERGAGGFGSTGKE